LFFSRTGYTAGVTDGGDWWWKLAKGFISNIISFIALFVSIGALWLGIKNYRRENRRQDKDDVEDNRIKRLRVAAINEEISGLERDLKKAHDERDSELREINNRLIDVQGDLYKAYPAVAGSFGKPLGRHAKEEEEKRLRSRSDETIKSFDRTKAEIDGKIGVLRHERDSLEKFLGIKNDQPPP
jgi:hypothetical protein